MSRHRCPSCQKTIGLWRGVSVQGWESVDETLKPTGEHDVEGWDADHDGTYGCSECGWEGYAGDFEVLGIDGEPLPSVHPQQMQIEARA